MEDRPPRNRPGEWPRSRAVQWSSGLLDSWFPAGPQEPLAKKSSARFGGRRSYETESSILDLFGRSVPPGARQSFPLRDSVSLFRSMCSPPKTA